jgi:hypothetical protein
MAKKCRDILFQFFRSQTHLSYFNGLQREVVLLHALADEKIEIKMTFFVQCLEQRVISVLIASFIAENYLIQLPRLGVPLYWERRSKQ